MVKLPSLRGAPIAVHTPVAEGDRFYAYAYLDVTPHITQSAGAEVEPRAPFKGVIRKASPVRSFTIDSAASSCALRILSHTTSKLTAAPGTLQYYS